MTSYGSQFFAKLHFKWGWTCKKYRNKAEMKTHKTTLLQNSGRKERPGDYICCIILYITADVYVVLYTVFLFNHCSIVGVVWCVVIPALFVYF